MAGGRSWNPASLPGTHRQAQATSTICGLHSPCPMIHSELLGVAKGEACG